MNKYYHVTEEWDGCELESLQMRHGDAALDIFCDRWPDAEILADAHSCKIHLHDNIDDAIDFRDSFGGQILEITLDEDTMSDVFLMIDDLEYPHPVACESIPAKFIKYYKDNN